MVYELSYLILLLPLLSFIVLGLAGMKMQHKTAGLIGTCSLSLVTILSYWTAFTYFTADRTAEGVYQTIVPFNFTWLPLGNLHFDMGILLDPISVMMLVVILVMITGMTIATWNGLISLLPALSVGITTIGYWTDNGQKIRASQLMGSPCTLVYDALIGSWGGVLSESITLVSIVVSIFRFGWKGLDDPSFAN